MTDNSEREHVRTLLDIKDESKLDKWGKFAFAQCMFLYQENLKLRKKIKFLKPTKSITSIDKWDIVKI